MYILYSRGPIFEPVLGYSRRFLNKLSHCDVYYRKGREVYLIYAGESSCSEIEENSKSPSPQKPERLTHAYFYNLLPQISPDQSDPVDTHGQARGTPTFGLLEALKEKDKKTRDK